MHSDFPGMKGRYTPLGETLLIFSVLIYLRYGGHSEGGSSGCFFYKKLPHRSF
ncbi:hypothetical protein HMPREF9555_00897 [Selenomonas artemidis F0399]|uniref:Uncharacterized protein n=1 Tax=Selenomonas artemidis F0399 TaxID=749551 RepID=E7N1R3_9FIRM|nr:hypothetical protein HMPREF9555_00897 [Selenomonas artemidis F0399]